jgi:hypothetical protein
MLRIEASDRDEDESVLFVDPAARRQLVTVLSDWLAIYAGVKPAGLTPEAFDLVVELRRILLTPDEPAVRSRLSARGGIASRSNGRAQD